MKKKELLEIQKKIPENKQDAAKMLVNELSFILTTSNKLKKMIRKDGPTEKFEQGSQNFIRESPALKSYNQLMKSFDTFLKSLLSLVPKTDDIPPDPEDEFDEFNK